MKTTSGTLPYELNFKFNTTYEGSEITLRIVSNRGTYSVLCNEKPIGHIKLGEIRHTWYVVDKNFVPGYLVDEIGNKITAQI